jgi:hypothetical protein
MIPHPFVVSDEPSSFDTPHHFIVGEGCGTQDERLVLSSVEGSNHERHELYHFAVSKVPCKIPGGWPRGSSLYNSEQTLSFPLFFA